MKGRRRIVLWSWLALLAAGLGVIAHARFSADMSAFLPRAPDARQRVLVEQLRDGLVSRIVLVGIDGADARARARVSTLLAGRLRATPEFAAVENGQSTRGARDFEFAYAHRYLLDSGPTPEDFRPAALHRAIGEAIARLASPMGSGLQRLLPSDPTGATLRWLGRVAPTEQPRLLDGVWASPDGRRALLLLVTRAAGTDTDAQQRALQLLHQAFEAARGASGSAAAPTRLVLGGPPVFAVHSRDAIERAVTRVSLLGASLIVVLLLLVYRSLPLLAAGLLPVFSGVVAATAAVALGFGVVQGITLGFGTTLMGEAVDYSIYLFVQSGEVPSGGREAWIEGFWPTVRLGMLTSVVGFASLLLSDFPGLAQIGAYSIAGLLGAAAVTRFVLPQLLPGSPGLRDLSGVGQRLLRVVQQLRRLRWLLPLLALASLAVLASQRAHVWNPRLSALSPIPRSMLAVDAQLRSEIGAPDSGQLVAVQGATQQQVLQDAQALAPRLRDLQRRGAIGGFDSPARYLPGEAAQRARQLALPDAQRLRADVRAAVRGLPVDAKVFEPFVADVAAARHAPLLRRRDFAGTSFALALDGMLLRGRDGRWTALLPLRAPAHGALDVQALREELRGTAAHYVDLGATSNRLYRDYLRTAIWLSLGGLAGIGLLLLATLRSPRRVARVLAPLVVAVLVLAAALVLLGVRLTLLHLVGMMLVVAVGSNYALFFERGEREGGIAPRTLASLVFANLSTVAGFAPLLLAGVPVLSSLGATVAPGAMLALLFSAMASKGDADGAPAPAAAPASPPPVPAKDEPVGRDAATPPLLDGVAAVHVIALGLLLARPLLWPWALAAVLLAHGVVTLLVLSPRTRWLGPNLVRLPPRHAALGEVAITLDDGPDPQVTPAVLDILDAHGAKASFFCIGERVARHPELAREMIRRGHRVENHSARHRHDFALLGPRGYRAELAAGQALIEAATGVAPSWFRAPAGFRNPMCWPAMRGLGLHLASWTRRGFDTRDGDPRRVLARLARGLAAGDIVLLHDGHSARTARGGPVVLEVLPQLLELLQRRGLRGVALPRPGEHPGEHPGEQA